VSLACDKAKKHAYPHELWTTGARSAMHIKPLDPEILGASIAKSGRHA
jgi:hypothetical protein